MREKIKFTASTTINPKWIFLWKSPFSYFADLFSLKYKIEPQILLKRCNVCICAYVIKILCFTINLGEVQYKAFFSTNPEHLSWNQFLASDSLSHFSRDVDLFIGFCRKGYIANILRITFDEPKFQVIFYSDERLYELETKYS